MAELSRREHAALYGPTVGDQLRLADTDLWIEIEQDLTFGGEEAVFGGGSVDWAIDSRIDLPPPKTASSPPKLRSCSTSIHRSVSARRTWSPTVGP